MKWIIGADKQRKSLITQSNSARGSRVVSKFRSAYENVWQAAYVETTLLSAPLFAAPGLMDDTSSELGLSAFLVMALVALMALMLRDQTHNVSADPAQNTHPFDLLRDPVFVTDAEECLVYLNPAARQILTVDAKTTLGKPIVRVLPNQALYNPPDEIPDELLYQPLVVSDGEVRQYQISVSPIYDDGFLSGHTYVLHDVTALQDELDTEQQAASAAQEASRISSDFLAVVSHEIRTPMQAVIGMTGLLLGTDLDDEQKDYVETIHSSGDSMLAILNNVLDFSKIEAGQIELEHQSFDPVAAVEDTLSIFGGQAAMKQIELAFIIGEDVPSAVLGDVTRFRQVLSNLIGNAVKFTDRGEVAVYINSQRQGENLLLHVRVQDSGIGIPEERMDRLFRNFSQVDASTARVYGGTGLGLAICKSLCEIMGGDVWVESRAGVGSTFNFTVLVGQDRSAVAALQRDEALTGRTAFVIDDNAASREMLATLMSSWGMQVQSFDSGWLALEALEKNSAVDIVLIDQHMPAMDGEAVARRIRSMHYRPEPRLVMLVSLTDSGTRTRATEIGLTSVLAKPLKRTQLHAALDNLFASKKPAETRHALSSSPSEKQRERTTSILLADDNKVGQRVTSALLRRLGYKADVVGSGQEVLKVMDERTYDVILMDVYMPELDGLSTTQRIRADYPHDHQPYVIALTASAIASDRQDCLNAGMNDYLSKPIGMKDLEAALDRATNYEADDE